MIFENHSKAVKRQNNNQTMAKVGTFYALNNCKRTKYSDIKSKFTCIDCLTCGWYGSQYGYIPKDDKPVTPVSCLATCCGCSGERRPPKNNLDTLVDELEYKRNARRQASRATRKNKPVASESEPVTANKTETTSNTGCWFSFW
jgi:hypothetical protein